MLSGRRGADRWLPASLPGLPEGPRARPFLLALHNHALATHPQVWGCRGNPGPALQGGSASLPPSISFSSQALLSRVQGQLISGVEVFRGPHLGLKTSWAFRGTERWLRLRSAVPPRPPHAVLFALTDQQASAPNEMLSWSVELGLQQESGAQVRVPSLAELNLVSCSLFLSLSSPADEVADLSRTGQ